MDATPEGTYPAPPRSWWSRNWKWAVPTGCLVLILGCCGAGALATAFGVMEGVVKPGLSVSGPAVQTARNDPRVQALLGTPVEASLPTNVQRHSANGGSRTRLAVPLRGPQGQGVLHVDAREQDGATVYDTLEVVVEGAEPIDLRARAQQPGPPQPPAPPPAPEPR